MSSSLAKRLAITIGIMAMATLLQWLAWSIISPLAYLLYYPAVTVAALYGSGPLAIFLAVILAQYFFVTDFSFLFFDWKDFVRIAVFAGNAYLITKITQALRTSRGAAEAGLAEVKQALQDLENEKNLREQFVNLLSHDLRTPLSAAKITAQLIARNPLNTEYVVSGVAKLIDNIDRTNDMIRDLLDANLVRAGESLPMEIALTDVRELVARSLEDLGTIYGGRFALVADHPVQAMVDGKALRRVIENLSNNAVKYGDPHRPITVSLIGDQKGFKLSVHNDGPTIFVEDQKILFEPFRRSKAAEKGRTVGWGLGLTLVKGIVEAHHGTIHVSSTENEGTTFTMEIPSKVS